MAKELTMQQFLDLNHSITVDENGKTNKKCPLCGNDVIVIKDGSSITTKCKTQECFVEVGRGI